MAVRINGSGSITGIADYEAVSLAHPDAVDANIVLSDDGSVAFDSIPADIQSAIDGAGGLVAVKHVLKTNTFSASVGAGANVAVDDLSITHEVADAANRLIITAFFGAAANAATGGQVGIAVHDGTGLIGIGDADGSRTRVAAGGDVSAVGNTRIVAMPSITFVHTPGAGSKTYTVRAVNTTTGTQTLFINRSQGDGNDAGFTRTVSGLVIQEVKV